MSIGGGEDPKEKPKGGTFKSQKELNDWNAWTQNFLMRKNAPMAAQSVVGRDIGDAKPKFVYAANSVQPDRPNLQTALPMGVSVNDVFQTNDGLYGYMHPQEGTFIQVDPQAIYSKYGSKK